MLLDIEQMVIHEYATFGKTTPDGELGLLDITSTHRIIENPGLSLKITPESPDSEQHEDAQEAIRPGEPPVVGQDPATPDQEAPKLSEATKSEYTEGDGVCWDHLNDAVSNQGSNDTSDNIKKTTEQILPFEQNQEGTQ